MAVEALAKSNSKRPWKVSGVGCIDLVALPHSGTLCVRRPGLSRLRRMLLRLTLAAARQVTCSALRPVQAEAPAGPRAGAGALRTADLYITKFYDTPSTAYLLLRQARARRLPPAGPERLGRPRGVLDVDTLAERCRTLPRHGESAAGRRLAAGSGAPEEPDTVLGPAARPARAGRLLTGGWCGQQQRQVMLADSSLLTSILDKVAPFKVRPAACWAVRGAHQGVTRSWHGLAPCEAHHSPWSM